MDYYFTFESRAFPEEEEAYAFDEAHVFDEAYIWMKHKPLMKRKSWMSRMKRMRSMKQSENSHAEQQSRTTVVNTLVLRKALLHTPTTSIFMKVNQFEEPSCMIIGEYHFKKYFLACCNHQGCLTNLPIVEDRPRCVFIDCGERQLAVYG